MPPTAVDRAMLDRPKTTRVAGDHPTAPARSGGLDPTARSAMVSAAADGDHRALEALWIDSRRWVAAIILAHMPRGASLDDLLQTVALQMCRRIEQVRDPDAFRPWLRTVAINVARADGRALGRQLDTIGSRLRLVGTELSSDPSTDGADASDDGWANGGSASRLASGSGTSDHPGRGAQDNDNVAATDDARHVLSFARELPEAYREPLLLRCARGMSYTQISAVLDLPETTIETRIARGRRMLREMIQRRQRQQSATAPQHDRPARASEEGTP